MKKLKSLSIFFPTLNDAKIIPYLVAKSYKTARQVASEFEVIIVNDGSTDETAEVLNELKKQYRNLKIITHKKNLGYGVALQSGFKAARYEWVFYTDGDGQYDVSEITKLVSKINDNISVVNGYKLTRGDGMIRKTIGVFNNVGLHVLYNLPIRDIDCDFRLIKRSLLEKINLTQKSGVICTELILKLKEKDAKFAEVGVHHYARPFGKSEFFRFNNVYKTLIDNYKFYKASKTNG